MSIPKYQVLKLYRDMMREATKFPAYNFRKYALRRIKHGFCENKTAKNEEVDNIFKDGLQIYESLKRQVLVSSLYKTDNLVVENRSTT